MPVALTEYGLTAGILIAFVGLIIGIVYDRNRIVQTLKGAGLRKRHLAASVAIVVAFLAVELYLVKPTQLLFFDDTIYQGMAQQLIHTGQAAMCDYGTPVNCFIGEIFHEPIGLSFNFVIAFLIFGVQRYAAYGAELLLAAMAVFMTFFVTLLMFRNAKAAAFAEVLMALSPAVLVWAMPTNSDMALLAYSLVALFFLLVFVRGKRLWSMSNMLMSFALLSYMRVNALLYLPVFAAIYLLLGGKGVLAEIKDAFGLAAKHLLDTDVLIALLVFVVALAPSITYAAYEYSYGDFGAVGQMQNTCSKNFTGVPVTGIENLQNFKVNVCSNVNFWFNAYSKQYIMQPVLFTALALLGAALLLMRRRRREVVAMTIWFLAFFVLYTAFYAGSVIYGVDWRFMLSLVAQPSILGGVAVAYVIEFIVPAKKEGTARLADYVAMAVAIGVLAFPIVQLSPMLSISPAQVMQAGDARFYEGFVYNASGSIPSSCLVYTYDPSLFNINGRAAIQLSYLYNTTQYNRLSSEYGCTVLDYGYWCHTPKNLCTYVNQSFDMTPIATATYAPSNYEYGFYYLNKKG